MYFLNFFNGMKHHGCGDLLLSGAKMNINFKILKSQNVISRTHGIDPTRLYAFINLKGLS
jgi:hypothetical protein